MDTQDMHIYFSNTHSQQRSPSPALSQAIPARINQSPSDIPEATKNAGISRTTYFRVLRNLRNHTGARDRPILPNGRPLKLNADADVVIRETMTHSPWTSLKELRHILRERCNVDVSVSSISRRLKRLGLQTGAAAQSASFQQPDASLTTAEHARHTH